MCVCTTFPAQLSSSYYLMNRRHAAAACHAPPQSLAQLLDVRLDDVCALAAAQPVILVQPAYLKLYLAALTDELQPAPRLAVELLCRHPPALATHPRDLPRQIADLKWLLAADVLQLRRAVTKDPSLLCAAPGEVEAKLRRLAPLLGVSMHSLQGLFR